jgi:hypothetical protein
MRAQPKRFTVQTKKSRAAVSGDQLAHHAGLVTKSTTSEPLSSHSVVPVASRLAGTIGLSVRSSSV